MKKIGLLLSLLFVLMFAGKNIAQNLICNDLVYFSLDQNCSHTIIPEEVLEGVLFTDCIVELDKTVPFGDGPWLAPVLGAADVGKTYQVRITYLPSGNKCWSNAVVEDKLPPVLECSGLSTVSLNGSNPVTVATTDLSVTATDACGASTLAPASIQFDCASLGVSTVQLTATDQSGNTSTCLHSVLVTSSTGCQACVSACPPPVTVSYDQGNIDLLNAFQNNSWSDFDVFGDASFNTSCNAIDSLYTIDYHPGTAGQSWFSRQWLWVTDLGQPVTCEQSIVFPSTHTVMVQGRVYLDASDDCVYDAGEQPLNHFALVMTKWPSGVSETVYPNPDGTYAFEVVLSVQDVSVQVHLALPPNVNPVCSTALNIPNSTATSSYQFDIGVQTQGDCPVMQVDLGDLFARRCFTNFIKVNYCNVGLDTAYGAFVTVNLDPLVELQSATLPYTVSGPDDLYTFQVGDVPPFFCGTIYLYTYVNCSAQLGQTLCNEANVYPETSCDAAWQGAEVLAKASCEGDSVRLELWNKGPVDMAIPLNYIVIEDFIMYKNGTFQLASGDSVTIKVPANGATWRIEAQQEPGFPLAGLVAAAIEGCGGINVPGMINAFGQSDYAINYDRECSEVRASCDPNDKTAVPTGLGEQHIIRPNEDIEYKIRFQNTGNDTAFQVVVVDTLSPLLDARTLELGASSHPYRLDIFPGGILHFVFQPIALPDSNVNEVESHGYLEFKIAQQADLPNGTVIENRAAIYFDQNDAVLTNTAFHTIGYPFLPNIPLALAAQSSPASCQGSADGSIRLDATGGVTPYAYHWNDDSLQGDSLTGLAVGLYFLTLTDSHGGEIVQSFEVTAPDAISITLNAAPTLGNNNNGAATSQVSGGTENYTYLWSNGATTASISGLAAGVYTLLVTDEHGCTQNSSVEVVQTVLPLVVTAQTHNPACFGASDGAIFLTITGGLLPYTFLWSDPALQGDTLSGLAAGNYGLTLTDSNGSQLEETFTLIDPPPFLINLDATPAVDSQNNGTASASVTGGNGGYTFLWSTGATTENILNLAPGTYTFVVTDANGCTESDSVVVEHLVPTVEPGMLSRVQVWPNPAHDRLMMDLRQVLPQLHRLDVLSADGRLLVQLKAGDLQPMLTLDLGHDPTTGMVLLVFYTGDGQMFTRKIMIH